MNCMRTGFILWRRLNSPCSSHHLEERREKWAISEVLIVDFGIWIGVGGGGGLGEPWRG